MERRKIINIRLLIVLGLALMAFKGEHRVLIPTESANERFYESMSWVKSNAPLSLAVESDNYQIVAVADCHVGSTTNLDKFIGVMNTVQPQAVLMVGDLTTGHSRDYEVFEDHLTRNFICPIFLVAGNHDEYFGGWEQFYKRFGPSTYCVSVKTPEASDLIICLETGGGTLGSAQLKWLGNTLKTARGQFRHCLVFTHNNLFRAHHTPSTNPFAEETEILVGLFTRYQVEVVVTGHDHKKDSRLFGKTRYLQIEALQDKNHNPDYLQLTVNGNSISHSFKKF